MPGLRAVTIVAGFVVAAGCLGQTHVADEMPVARDEGVEPLREGSIWRYRGPSSDLELRLLPSTTFTDFAGKPIPVVAVMGRTSPRDQDHSLPITAFIERETGRLVASVTPCGRTTDECAMEYFTRFDAAGAPFAFGLNWIPATTDVAVDYRDMGEADVLTVKTKPSGACSTVVLSRSRTVEPVSFRDSILPTEAEYCGSPFPTRLVLREEFELVSVEVGPGNPLPAWSLAELGAPRAVLSAGLPRAWGGAVFVTDSPAPPGPTVEGAVATAVQQDMDAREFATRPGVQVLEARVGGWSVQLVEGAVSQAPALDICLYDPARGDTFRFVLTRNNVSGIPVDTVERQEPCSTPDGQRARPPEQTPLGSAYATARRFIDEPYLGTMVTTRLPSASGDYHFSGPAGQGSYTYTLLFQGPPVEDANGNPTMMHWPYELAVHAGTGQVVKLTTGESTSKLYDLSYVPS